MHSINVKPVVIKSVLAVSLLVLILSQSLLFSQQHSGNTQQRRIRKECWESENTVSLLDTMKSAMNRGLEADYDHHDFIQTFGCAYEEDDIEQNSIKAVYRAVLQSIRNRKITFRDDVMTLLKAKPPRPDNLTREYVIYVNLVEDTEIRAARYEIQILNLEAIPTIESEMAVWTRIITRFAYKDDYNRAAKPVEQKSEFVNVMDQAQKIMQAAEFRKFSEIEELVGLKSTPIAYPARIIDLLFGDTLKLFFIEKPERSYPAVFLGRGMYVTDIPKTGVVVCKFGEERLFGMQIDADSFQRNLSIFEVLDYEAPESILQCLFLKFNSLKPAELPHISESD
ncbi:hypothetical protein JXJ21_06640 [candidate division KSB1 bacterium]|nr:hypothetical protein [candidate division KSB1 bacterium]